MHTRPDEQRRSTSFVGQPFGVEVCKEKLNPIQHGGPSRQPGRRLQLRVISTLCGRETFFVLSDSENRTRVRVRSQATGVASFCDTLARIFSNSCSKRVHYCALQGYNGKVNNRFLFHVHRTPGRCSCVACSPSNDAGRWTEPFRAVRWQ